MKYHCEWCEENFWELKYKWSITDLATGKEIVKKYCSLDCIESDLCTIDVRKVCIELVAK